jgi:pyruvate formate lyase activating enzyme
VQDRTLGLLKTTLLDFPGEIAATVFTAGCNLRCPYCHNPELVTGRRPADFIAVNQVLEFLKQRRGVLSGVCVSGGEPLLNDWLPELFEEIKGLGYKIKLDTNGLLPERLATVTPDMVAIDLKLSPARYHNLGARMGAEKALRSTIDQVRERALGVEYRTTVVPGLVGDDDLREIVKLLRKEERLVLSAFRPTRTLDPLYQSVEPPSEELLKRYQQFAIDAGIDCHVRMHHG